MYEVADDTYCYPGTTVLRNKIATKQQNVLDDFEAEMTSQRATEPMPDGNLDYAHYLAIHKHLLQDVYPWAGMPSFGGEEKPLAEMIEGLIRK